MGMVLNNKLHNKEKIFWNYCPTFSIPLELVVWLFLLGFTIFTWFLEIFCREKVQINENKQHFFVKDREGLGIMIKILSFVFDTFIVNVSFNNKEFWLKAPFWLIE